MADGSEKSFTTQDTTSLPAMTGVLGTEHGGTGKETPLTAEDVGAVEAGSGVYLKALTVQGNTMTVTKGDGSTETVMLAQEYVLPAATADALGGVKVGDYLDIAPDGTLSGKTLNDKIAAAVAVKSEPRLVWTYGKFDIDRERVHTYQAPSDVDYFVYKCASSDESVTIPRGNTVKTSIGQEFTITFQTDGTITFTHAKSSYNSRSYVYNVTFTGYHYPTLADLLTQVTAVESSVTDLQVALCELYEEKEEN